MGVLRNVLNWYSRLTPGRKSVKPPFQHVVQIGDPTLRRACDAVPENIIRTTEIQTIIRRLQKVLISYNSVGMSAPQIGINKRIFVVHLSDLHMKNLSSKEIRDKQITSIPFTVFINPKLKILDHTLITFIEGCESIRGLAASVPRCTEVEVSGLNEKGESLIRRYKGWGARVVQHEIDHLDGKMYIDFIDTKTLHCTCWEEVNYSRGNLVIPFGPS